MLNIIVYSGNKNNMNNNINIVNKALANFDIDYRIHKFSIYNEKFIDFIKNNNDKKIYILDVGMKDDSGLDVATLIRANDFDSVIIFVTKYDKYHNDIFDNRLMVLDFICKCDEYEKRLREDIVISLKIIYKENIFVFKYNHVIYRVPYSHINYIEKEPLIKRCIIHTTTNDFYIANSIERLTSILGNCFIKTHQSCIINLNNINAIDCVNNKVIFLNGNETSLITDKAKKLLKDIF